MPLSASIALVASYTHIPDWSLSTEELVLLLSFPPSRFAIDSICHGEAR